MKKAALRMDSAQEEPVAKEARFAMPLCRQRLDLMLLSRQSLDLRRDSQEDVHWEWQPFPAASQLGTLPACLQLSTGGQKTVCWSSQLSTVLPTASYIFFDAPVQRPATNDPPKQCLWRRPERPKHKLRTSRAKRTSRSTHVQGCAFLCRAYSVAKVVRTCAMLLVAALLAKVSLCCWCARGGKMRWSSD